MRTPDHITFRRRPRLTAPLSWQFRRCPTCKRLPAYGKISVMFAPLAGWGGPALWCSHCQEIVTAEKQWIS
jgi:hypothetical protein